MILHLDYIDSHIDISLSAQLCCSILFLPTHSSDYLRSQTVWSGCLCLLCVFDYVTAENEGFHLLYRCPYIFIMKNLSSGLCMCWPSLLPTWISVFDASSPSAPLFSLFSRGHGSFIGPSLSSSTTPRAETILSSCFYISHSKYNL